MSAPTREHPDPIHILLAEDNPADVRLLRELLKESAIHNELHVVPDGEEALAYLRHRGKYANSPRPDLMFLDLNMPRTDGREVLRNLKSDPQLRRIPVIIMTSSQAEEDIQRAYDDHANCYIRKPADFTQLQAVFKKIEDFWFTAVELPST